MFGEKVEGMTLGSFEHLFLYLDYFRAVQIMESYKKSLDHAVQIPPIVIVNPSNIRLAGDKFLAKTIQDIVLS